MEKMTDYMDVEEIITELFFGLIMALNIGNIMRLALIDQSDAFILSVITFAILGGNLAWGLADGAMNALARNVRLHHEHNTLEHLSRLEDEEEARTEARRIVRDGMPPLQADLVDDRIVDIMAVHLIERVREKKMPHPSIGAEGWVVLFSSILLNLVAALPILMVWYLVGSESVNAATLISNVVGMVFLFFLGLSMGRRASGRLNVFAGLAMTCVGLAIVALVTFVEG
ncbi:MAG: hypothetical protein WCK39_04760 [Methanomassiliicoccales archaeon]